MPLLLAFEKTGRSEDKDRAVNGVVMAHETRRGFTRQTGSGVPCDAQLSWYGGYDLPCLLILRFFIFLF
jgi:hypothetical protein